jgi:hypothetical protein
MMCEIALALFLLVRRIAIKNKANALGWLFNFLISYSYTYYSYFLMYFFCYCYLIVTDTDIPYDKTLKKATVPHIHKKI